VVPKDKCTYNMPDNYWRKSVCGNEDKKLDKLDKLDKKLGFETIDSKSYYDMEKA